MGADSWLTLGMSFRAVHILFQLLLATWLALVTHVTFGENFGDPVYYSPHAYFLSWWERKPPLRQRFHQPGSLSSYNGQSTPMALTDVGMYVEWGWNIFGMLNNQDVGTICYSSPNWLICIFIWWINLSDSKEWWGYSWPTAKTALITHRKVIHSVGAEEEKVENYYSKLALG